ncbi:LacI family DNA-binding transcriptional regulator [Paenirhodobacter populi]|uniref:LacI family DNA-binding transcriptional regulator n=1 Tax=Paenirhodobacter populi TaxID=2306993 RepID=UPI00240DC9D2|nr:LacI family DNA-binding transcriptional regulator [Sinirhodobacter populi]
MNNAVESSPLVKREISGHRHSSWRSTRSKVLDQGRKKIRSFEVAERANISRSTVSRVFSGDPRISEETRSRVMAAATELGYRPNLIARGLKNSRTGIVGVVVTEIGSAYHSLALQMLVEKMASARLAPLVFVGKTQQGTGNAIARLMSYQVDAVIALAAPFADDIVEACKAGKKPLVLMNDYSGAENVATVGTDNYLAGQMVAKHLIARGARRFAFFGGQDGTDISNKRSRGYSDTISEAGHSLSLWSTAHFDYVEALAAARDLARQALDSRVDAIFAANDTLAFALSDVLRDIAPPGSSLPLLVGYDNSAMSNWPGYDLTSVDHNLDDMIDLSIQTAINMADDPFAPAPKRLIQPVLVARGSTSSNRLQRSL